MKGLPGAQGWQRALGFHHATGNQSCNKRFLLWLDLHVSCGLPSEADPMKWRAPTIAGAPIATNSGASVSGSGPTGEASDLQQRTRWLEPMPTLHDQLIRLLVCCRPNGKIHLNTFVMIKNYQFVFMHLNVNSSYLCWFDSAIQGVVVGTITYLSNLYGI